MEKEGSLTGELMSDSILFAVLPRLYLIVSKNCVGEAS